MKKNSYLLLILPALIASRSPTRAQNPVITSFSQNGVLVCSNLNPGSVASVEWAPSVTGPWNTNWASLNDVPVDSNGTVEVGVPMFYRVRGVPAPVPAPAGMVLIPGGSFAMGDTLDGDTNAIPITVYVSSFYMDTNLVTLSLWQSVYTWATNHGYSFDFTGSGKAANHPVQTVDWDDCLRWCNARSQQAGLTPVYYTDSGLTHVYTNNWPPVTAYANWSANGYRLPTEAEWEKAARGGLNGHRFPWGDTISESQANYYSSWTSGSPDLPYDVNPYAGYNTNFNTGPQPYTSPVGYFAANGYGLNDMAGNVMQWCWDWYGTPYGQPTTNNPTGPTVVGIVRVVRGGSWINWALTARCACRGENIPGGTNNQFGFRCVRGS